jgi:thiamine biosynthesis protein ThiS
MINVIVNGEQRFLSQALNVADLVRELQLVPATLLIEHNGKALHRTEWNLRALANGDRIELVRVAAGG